MSLGLVQVADRPERKGSTLLPLIFGQQAAVSPWHWLGCAAASILVPMAILVTARLLPPPSTPELPPMEIVLGEMIAPKPLAPPPPPVQPEEPEEKPATPSPVRAKAAPVSNAKARAGKVIAMPSEAPAPSDTPGGAIVTGEADSYAGGVTASSGTSAKPVEEVAPEPPRQPERPRVDVVAVTRSYLAQVRELLAREKRYPLAAQRNGIEGTVIVSFVIDAGGRFGQVRVVSSSGNDLLDAAATEAVGEQSGRVARPRETGDLSLPLKTAFRFEIPR